MTFARIPARTAAAFNGEALKAITFPALRWTILLGLAAVVGIAGFGVLQALRGSSSGAYDTSASLELTDWPMFALHYGQVIPILLGSWVVGQDTASGSLRIALLANPHRIISVLAKYSTVVIIAVLTAAVCTMGAFVPLILSDEAEGASMTSHVGRVTWLAGYWVLIGMVSAGITAMSRSTMWAVVPLSIWVLGLADILRTRLPVLSGAVDQVFDDAYRGGVIPEPGELALALAQVLAVVISGAVVWARRDAH